MSTSVYCAAIRLGEVTTSPTISRPSTCNLRYLINVTFASHPAQPKMHWMPISQENIKIYKRLLKICDNCWFWLLLLIMIYSDLRSEEAIDEQIQSRIIVIGRSEFQCAECGQLASLKPNMWKHIEAKHMAPQPAPCMYCNKLCPSKNALASHVSRYHRAEKKF